MSLPKVHLFIDNSNIFISAKNEAIRREGRAAQYQVRLQFTSLIELAVGGRELVKACVVGSSGSHEQLKVWERLEQDTGVKPELYERGGVTGGEQGVDQCLQVHMLRAMADDAEPQVAVLMTGDGAGYDDGVGFHADLERMHTVGWGIEVIGWQHYCRAALRQWAAASGVFVPLDDYYPSITFLEDGRRTAPLDLSARLFAKPRPSPAKAAEAKLRHEWEAKLHALETRIEAMEAEQAAKAAAKARHDKRFTRGRT